MARQCDWLPNPSVFHTSSSTSWPSIQTSCTASCASGACNNSTRAAVAAHLTRGLPPPSCASSVKEAHLLSSYARSSLGKRFDNIRQSLDFLIAYPTYARCPGVESTMATPLTYAMLGCCLSTLQGAALRSAGCMGHDSCWTQSTPAGTRHPLPLAVVCGGAVMLKRLTPRSNKPAAKCTD